METLFVAAALAVATFVLVPASKAPSPAEQRAACAEWQHAYGSVVPPDLWGIAGTDGRTSGFSTTSDMDPEAVERILAARPDNCEVPEPPPGAGGGGWHWEPAR